MAAILDGAEQQREALQAALAEKEAEYKRLHEQLTALRLELEGLAPRLRYVQAEDSVTRGAQHHDALCQAMGEAAVQICETWTQFTQACSHFVQTRDSQIRGLFLPDASGEMAWELESGTAALQQMLGAFPHQGADLATSVLHGVRFPPTHEEMQRAIATTPGRAPFPPERVEQYLATYATDTKGKEDHGSP
jgi:hypothetical protein